MSKSHNTKPTNTRKIKSGTESDAEFQEVIKILDEIKSFTLDLCEKVIEEMKNVKRKQ